MIPWFEAPGRKGMILLRIGFVLGIIGWTALAAAALIAAVALAL